MDTYVCAASPRLRWIMGSCVNPKMTELTAGRRTEPCTADKVRFLLEPGSYRHRPGNVESVETHFAWVFLAGPYAYKLKKPVFHGALDLRTLGARERDCRDELRLNRRLAQDIYLEILPLCADGKGKLKLGNGGRPVDWLVKMRRLPAGRMLDNAIRDGTLRPEELRPLVNKLARFYQGGSQTQMTAGQYLKRLTGLIEQSDGELRRKRFELNLELVASVGAAQRAYLHDNPDVFTRRVREHRIVEAHGDLRPEHIYLGDESHPEPAVIDCLEFSRDLRVMDCADELAFLALECERLDAAPVGALIIQYYREYSGDDAPEPLVRFYKSLRACVRATLSVWHLLDPDTGPSAHWIRQATEYLIVAKRYLS